MPFSFFTYKSIFNTQPYSYLVRRKVNYFIFCSASSTPRKRVVKEGESLFTKYLGMLFIAIIVMSCVNPKIVHPSPKVGFDVNSLDKEGLITESDKRIAINYEFCIPSNTQCLNEVIRIDPSLKIYKKAKGRIPCSKQEWLCMGNTQQKFSRQKIQSLAELTYIKRIQRAYLE